MTYISRLYSRYAVTAKPAVLIFKDVLKMVKILYPDLKMQFPKPPTYIWNPKKTPDEIKDKDKAETDDDSDIDETAKLEPQKIKDKLKVKLPQLKWNLRMTDGIEEAELGFDDGSTALFEIGAKANHLTLTYTEAPKGISLEYDDSDKEDTKEK
jgi:hypothetical protein